MLLLLWGFLSSAVWKRAADFGNKSKKVEMKRDDVATTKLVEMGNFVT